MNKTAEVIRSALGYYRVTGDLADADCAFVHSFGETTDELSVNFELDDTALRIAGHLPIIADQTAVEAFPNQEIVACVVEGPVSNYFGSGVGTWGTLLKGAEFMAENGLKRPLQIGQAHHVGRIAMQATKLEMNSIVPPGLTHRFEPRAEGGQIWTRSLAWWFPREVLGSFELRRRGQL